MCPPRAEITTAASLQITPPLFDCYSVHEKAGLASICTRFRSLPSFVWVDSFWLGFEWEPIILSVGEFMSDCPLCKFDFACDWHGFLFSGFSQFGPLDRLLGCYRFLFAAILDISRYLPLLWVNVSVLVVHGYEFKVNLWDFFDFSQQGVKDELNDVSLF
jgi:hypothetical protein